MAGRRRACLSCQPKIWQSRNDLYLCKNERKNGILINLVCAEDSEVSHRLEKDVDAVVVAMADVTMADERKSFETC